MAIEIQTVNDSLMEAFVALQPIVSGEWVAWDTEAVAELRTVVATLNDFALNIRGEFDRVLWEQQDKGRFNEIDSVRKRREPDADKPGRKAAEPTMAERFAKFGKR